MGTDCAWCGTGEGICDDCMATMFAKSSELAATGLYLSPTDEDETEQAAEESEAQSRKK